MKHRSLQWWIARAKRCKTVRTVFVSREEFYVLWEKLAAQARFTDDSPGPRLAIEFRGILRVLPESERNR